MKWAWSSALFEALVKRAGFYGAVATVIGGLGFLWRPLELFTHFRVQYFLVISIAAAILFFMGKHRFCLMIAPFALVNLFFIGPLYVAENTAPGNVNPIRVMSYNVYSRNNNYEEVVEYIMKQDFDVILLTEITKSWNNKLKSLSHIYEHQVSIPREDNFGMALMSKWPFVEKTMFTMNSTDLPMAFAKIEIKGQEIIIIGAHPPPPVSMDFIKDGDEYIGYIIEKTNAFSAAKILLGDFNATNWSHTIRRLLEKASLKDTSAGFGVQPTWPSKLPLMWIPIDHCLVSDSIQTLDRKTGPAMGSDHYPIILNLGLPETAN